MTRRDLFTLVSKVGILAAAQLVPWHALEAIGIGGNDWIAEAASLPQNYVVRQPTLITDFSSTTGMTLTQGTGTVALDADPLKVRTGTQSLKITQAAGATSALVDLDCRNNFGGGASGIDASRDNLWHLRSLVDVPANQNNLSFFVANSVGFTTYFASAKMGPQIGSAQLSLWWDRPENRKDWAVGAGSPSWASNVQTIRIRPNANANGPLTTWLDALYRGGYARPKILLTFDDSSDGQYTIAKPILDTYGLKGTFYLIGQPVSLNTGGAISQAQADTLYAEGHDLCPHSWTQAGHTNWATLSADEVQAELQSWLTWGRARDYTRSIQHHAHPLGATSAAVDSTLVNLGFLTSRSTLRLLQSHLLGLDTPRFLRSYSWGNADGTAGPISWMNDAVTYGTSLFLTFHVFHATTTAAPQQISAADFTTIVRHAYRLQQAGLADVETVSQWYDGLTTARRRRVA